MDMTPEQSRNCKILWVRSIEMVEDKFQERREGIEITPVVGCEKCNNTGYLGKNCYYEVMPISEKISKLIVEKASAAEFKSRQWRMEC